MRNVLIIGLGLIGGSLGLALKRASANHPAQGYHITGYDRSHQRLRQAEQMGAIDRASDALSDAVSNAELLITATPILAIRDLFAEIGPVLAKGSIVTDTASTKAAVMRWAQELLPPGTAFIGGHPMAGDTGSLEAARPDLFQGATYCVIPGPDVHPSALETVSAFISALGAAPLFIDAAAHDRDVAAISHLPLIAAAALMQTVAGEADTDLLRRLASSGFRDTTRLAAGDPIMHHDISLTNREAVLGWLDAYIEQLQTARNLLGSAATTEAPARDQRLLRFFEQARQQRKNIIEVKNP
jgi:prephenate dehydrogenase